MPRRVPRGWKVNTFFDIYVLRVAAELRGEKEKENLWNRTLGV